MYDGHESVFVLLFGWLEPTNFDNSAYKRYASQLSIDLLYSEECLENKKDISCFTVQLMFNGKVLEFAEHCQNPAKCTYHEFMNKMDSIWYKGKDADDWQKACEL